MYSDVFTFRELQIVWSLICKRKGVMGWEVLDPGALNDVIKVMSQRPGISTVPLGFPKTLES